MPPFRGTPSRLERPRSQIARIRWPETPESSSTSDHHSTSAPVGPPRPDRGSAGHHRDRPARPQPRPCTSKPPARPTPAARSADGHPDRTSRPRPDQGRPTASLRGPPYPCIRDPFLLRRGIWRRTAASNVLTRTRCWASARRTPVDEHLPCPWTYPRRGSPEHLPRPRKSSSASPLRPTMVRCGQCRHLLPGRTTSFVERWSY